MDFTDEDYEGFGALDESERQRLVRSVMQELWEKRLAEGLDEFDEPVRALTRQQSARRDFNDRVNEGYLRRLANRGGPISAEDTELLSRIAGRSPDGFSPFDGDDEGVTDEMLEGYAKYLRNYLYTYKDEAQDIDPSIDPEEEHAGPMAQDIEKVAPDCVKETPEGVKTVDGNRLALVNAGVIGELSRRVLELEEKLNVTAIH